MKSIPVFLVALFLFAFNAFGQSAPEPKILYIIDSIPVIEDPGLGNDIGANDIESITIEKNKDSLKKWGYDQFDGVAFVITREYVKRPDSIKQVPSSKQMERKNDVWYFRGAPYTGRFIDYYYNGRKQGEGIFKDGKVDGLRKMYNQNGTVALERRYLSGISHGLEKEFYEDGSMKQKGEFVNGKYEGVWETYFPNGQLKGRCTYKNDTMVGEVRTYYSTGRILTITKVENRRTILDKGWGNMQALMTKARRKSDERDFNAANKYYTKVIELDSLYAEAYFARGTVKLNDQRYDQAIVDFDKALAIEPFHERALTYRAFARITKHELANSRKLSQSHGVSVLAVRSNNTDAMPEDQRELICNDLKQALFLGDDRKSVKEAITRFCQPRQNP